jgi:hypothetical protein
MDFSRKLKFTYFHALHVSEGSCYRDANKNASGLSFQLQKLVLAILRLFFEIGKK